MTPSLLGIRQGFPPLSVLLSPSGRFQRCNRPELITGPQAEVDLTISSTALQFWRLKTSKRVDFNC